jgi:hypothetical protein
MWPCEIFKGFHFEGLAVIDTASWGTLRRSWLRQYATSRKVTGSIADDVIGIFH